MHTSSQTQRGWNVKVHGAPEGRCLTGTSVEGNLARFVQDHSGDELQLAEEISKQRVEGAAWFLLAAHGTV